MGRSVRSVFSKSRSRHDTRGSSNGVEKRKWSSSVRSYLCGDEFNSVLAAEADLASFTSNRATNTSSNGGDISSAYAEDDTASVRSSEATVNQPLHTDENRPEKRKSAFQQEDAARIIQSAFRSFLARRAGEEGKIEVTGSPSRESIGTSVEVQIGNSSDIFSIKEESSNVSHKTRHRNRAQVLKIQEDWDDSTVSGVISRMRLQNKLEAATRRERALAYAFSQQVPLKLESKQDLITKPSLFQLRICSKKKKSDETNMGWSWLERWMAARQPEINLIEESIMGTQKTLVRKRLLDAAVEEKESCGSNELANSSLPNNIPKPPKNTSTKANKSFSTQSTNFCPTEPKDVKKVWHVEDEKEKRKRQKQPGHKRDL